MIDLEGKFLLLGHNFHIVLLENLEILVLCNFFQLLLKLSEHMDQATLFFSQSVAFTDKLRVFGLDFVEHLVLVFFDPFVDDGQSVQLLGQKIALFDQFLSINS